MGMEELDGVEQQHPTQRKKEWSQRHEYILTLCLSLLSLRLFQWSASPSQTSIAEVHSSLFQFIPQMYSSRVSHRLALVTATHTKSIAMGLSLISHGNRNEQNHTLFLNNTIYILTHVITIGERNTCRVCQRAASFQFPDRRVVKRSQMV